MGGWWIRSSPDTATTRPRSTSTRILTIAPETGRRAGNALNPDLSETYQYDALGRLTEWAVNGVEQQTWALDALGNDLSTGTYDAANEETPTQGSSGYDAAGNMTTLQSGDTAVYDAWNRMTEVDNGSEIVEKYGYGGTNRRIQIASDFSGSTPGTVTDDYYAGQQVVESDVTAGRVRNGGYQYLWSPRYIDAPILRDTLTTDGTAVVAAGRVFYLGDANFNVTALVSAAGTVVERYAYTPYGEATVYDQYLGRAHSERLDRRQHPPLRRHEPRFAIRPVLRPRTVLRLRDGTLRQHRSEGVCSG